MAFLLFISMLRQPSKDEGLRSLHFNIILAVALMLYCTHCASHCSDFFKNVSVFFRLRNTTDLHIYYRTLSTHSCKLKYKNIKENKIQIKKNKTKKLEPR